MQAVKNRSDGGDVISAILNSSGDGVPHPKALVTCKFVRDVGMGSVVSAFKDAFVGLPKEVIDEFAIQLESAVGTTGMKKDDEVLFMFLGDGEVRIIRNGKVGGGMRNKEAERRLLELYVTPERAVSPELVNCFQSNVQKVEP